jgi:hypothetical protein
MNGIRAATARLRIHPTGEKRFSFKIMYSINYQLLVVSSTAPIGIMTSVRHQARALTYSSFLVSPFTVSALQKSSAFSAIVRSLTTGGLFPLAARARLPCASRP